MKWGGEDTGMELANQDSFRTLGGVDHRSLEIKNTDIIKSKRKSKKNLSQKKTSQNWILRYIYIYILQFLEALHIKTKRKLELIELTLKIAAFFWSAFRPFFLIFYFFW